MRRKTCAHCGQKLPPEPLLRDFHKQARPGCCSVCDKRLPAQSAGRKRKICPDPECLRTYSRLYSAIARDLRKTIALLEKSA